MSTLSTLLSWPCLVLLKCLSLALATCVSHCFLFTYLFQSLLFFSFNNMKTALLAFSSFLCFSHPLKLPPSLLPSIVFSSTLSLFFTLPPFHSISHTLCSFPPLSIFGVDNSVKCTLTFVRCILWLYSIFPGSSYHIAMSLLQHSCLPSHPHSTHIQCDRTILSHWDDISKSRHSAAFPDYKQPLQTTPYSHWAAE